MTNEEKELTVSIEIQKLKERERRHASEFRRIQELIKSRFKEHEREINSLFLMMYEERYQELRIHSEIERLSGG